MEEHCPGRWQSSLLIDVHPVRATGQGPGKAQMVKQEVARGEVVRKGWRSETTTAGELEHSP